MQIIKKAIITAAGFGTRMLPATKAVPKEMLPVVGKPIIQHVVEEAVSAGIESILIIISKGKEAIKDHFAPNRALEQRLRSDEKWSELEMVSALDTLADIQFIYQHDLKGLGDAVYLGKSFVDEDAFALLLGDTIIFSEDSNQLGGLMSLYSATKSSCVLVESVPDEQVSKYGIMAGIYNKELLAYQVDRWVEKPPLNEAPGNLAVAARYVFTSGIFNCLNQLPRGVNNEVQLTDAMHALLTREKTYAKILNGTRYDIGDIKGFVKANVELFAH